MKKIIGITLEENIYNVIKKLAYDNNVSKSKFCKNIVSDYLKNKNLI